VSLNVGELIATMNLDDRGLVAGITRAEARMHVLGADAEVTGRRVRAGLDEALQELPEIDITADTSEADREVAALRQRLMVLRDLTITPDMDTTQVRAAADEVRARLATLAEQHPDIVVQAQIAHAITALDVTAGRADALGAMDPTLHVGADTGDATAGLAHVAAEAEAVDRLNPRVDVRVDDHGSTTGLIGRLGSLSSSFFSAIGAAAGFLRVPAMIAAAIPLAAALAATLASIAPAAAIGATGVLSLVSAVGAIKLGTGGIGDALKAAFAPASGGGGSAAGKAAAGINAVADAQRQLKQATENAAYANKQAAQQVAQSERDLADAQQAALRAQKAVNDARHAAVRDLQDLNNSLTDSVNQEREAQFAVSDAAAALTKAQATGDPDQIARAQLAYDEAVQALKEQQLQVKRLTSDTAAANKAGVEGSKQVTDAKQQEALAVRDVQDKTLALANAQEQQARTAAQGLDQIRQAQEALARAGAAGGGGGGGAASVDRFADAMAKLSPAARAFVREVIGLKPAFDSLKLGVQERLFAGLAAALGATAAAVLPPLRRGLDGTASALNRAALGALGAARNLGRSGLLGRALDGATAGLRNLTRVPGQVVTALGQIAVAGAPQFDRLTKAAGSAFDRISAKLSKSFASGGMSRAIDQAVTVLKELGTIMRNVGSIIGSVFDAAQSSGGSFIQLLGKITGTLAKAFSSPAVQSALMSVFSVMATLGKTVAPLLVQALSVIAPVLTALGPPVMFLVQALGDALQPIIKALGPVLLAVAGALGQLVYAVSPLLVVVGQMIAALGPVLTPIIKIIGSVFSALAPVMQELGRVLLPPFAKLTGTLAKAFGELAPVVGDALDQLGTGLIPVVDALVTVIANLVDQYADQFIGLFEQLLPLIPVLVPVVVQLATSIGQVLAAVAPLVPQLATLGIQFISSVLPAILPLIPPLAQLAVLLLQLATGVIVRVVVPALKGIVTVLDAFRRAFQPAIDAVKWLTTTIAGLFEWLYDHLVGHSVIPDLVRAIVSWFAGLPGKAVHALGDIAKKLGGVIEAAATSMIQATITGLKAVVSWIGDLPDRVVLALGDLGATLYHSGASLIGGFVSGMVSKLDLVKESTKSILGTVKDYFPNSPAKRGPFSGPGWTFHSGAATARDYAAGLDASRDLVGASAAGLMGRAAGSLGRLNGLGGGSGGLGLTGGGGDAITHHVALDITVSGPEEVTRLIRQIVHVNGGGSVQKTFGYGG
jgi:phage-related protein